MKEILDDIWDFQITTFPDSKALSKAHHLKKEVGELIDDLEGNREPESVLMEYADCFILLFGSVMAYGLNLEDIKSIIQKKMAINRTRKWGKPDENGVVLHEK